MNSRNLKFFKKKKKWSETKDAILGCYLIPYFAKIFHKKCPVCYIDCFAGKGKFDDGFPGSPLIALDCINKTYQTTTSQNIISTHFIELNFASELQDNITEYIKSNARNSTTANVYSGKFEDNIDAIISKHQNESIFMYVDPYGIKALDIERFNNFKLSPSASIEILINFNTWGFIREACRIFKVNFEFDPSLNDYLIEFDSNENVGIDELTRIAGGDYWIDIISRFEKKIITPLEAEKELSAGIKNAFLSKYKFVLDVPIMSSDNCLVPKYRLFHLTNHEEGCILMADTMYNKIKSLRISNRNEQLSIFDYTTEGVIIDDEKIKNNILKYVSTSNEHLNKVLCDFYVNEGAVCSKSTICNLLKKLKDEEMIKIDRFPPFTEKTNKPSTFMNEDKQHKVFLRRT